MGSRSTYAGRGPKDYRRSDDRIREDISDRLTDDPLIDASEISVQVRSGEVTLSGAIGSRWEKRRAEDVAEDVSGVKEVLNNLRISRADEQSATSASQAGQAGQSGQTTARTNTSSKGSASAG
jgi:osmotically-inducible protein OsmY